MAPLAAVVAAEVEAPGLLSSDGSLLSVAWRGPAWSSPTLLLSSREDHVVQSESGDVLEARVSGPVERIWLEDSYHVATLDNDAPLVESRVTAFLTSVFGGTA